jgi:glycosyltransferase involved in cell wall biosynthesis
MDHPLVSVIVPCYNQARFLPEAVASVQAQTYPYWECLIINDGSSDETAETGRALAAADGRVYLITQANRGLSGARNRGLAEAKGQFVQWLDADDCLEPSKLELHAKWLTEHPEVGVVYGDARYFTTENPDLRAFGLLGPGSPWSADEAWIGRLWACGRPLAEVALERNIMAVNCALVRRQVFDSIGGWAESLQALEDWEFWSRCLFEGVRFQYLDGPEAKALVRSHAASMCRDSGLHDRSAVELRILLGPLLPDAKSRLMSYRHGQAALARLPQTQRGRLALRLLRANWCRAVGELVVRDGVRRVPWVRKAFRALRSLGSWAAARTPKPK